MNNEEYNRISEEDYDKAVAAEKKKRIIITDDDDTYWDLFKMTMLYGIAVPMIMAAIVLVVAMCATLHRSQSASAKIIDISNGSSVDAVTGLADDAQCCTYEYIVNNLEYDFVWYDEHNRSHLGDTMTIYYDPHNPSDWSVANIGGGFFGILPIVAFFLIMSALPAVKATKIAVGLIRDKYIDMKFARNGLDSIKR